MNPKDWKEYDPEHLQDIENKLNDMYSDVQKQDIWFLINRFKEYKRISEELNIKLQAEQQAHNNLREKLKEIGNYDELPPTE